MLVLVYSEYVSINGLKSICFDFDVVCKQMPVRKRIIMNLVTDKHDHLGLNFYFDSFEVEHSLHNVTVGKSRLTYYRNR